MTTRHIKRNTGKTTGNRQEPPTRNGLRRIRKRSGDTKESTERRIQTKVRARNRGRNRDKDRNSHLLKNYGITQSDYEDRFKEQGGVCLLCQHPPKKRSLDVDHDHNIDEVRGLLCQNCNRMLGWAKDDIQTLERAIHYLKYGAKSMSLNKVILVGRLGKDPEVRYTPSGKAVANISLATDEPAKDGEKQTEWHSVIAWDKTAENVGKFLKKGSLVAVEGRLQTRKYESKGETKYKTEVVASNVRFLDKKSDAPVTSNPKPAVRPQAQEVADEDIPF